MSYAAATAVPDVLLAKSRRGDTSLSLEKHCSDTEEAAVRLFAPDVRWGRAWRRFFRIDGDPQDRFFLNLRVAALFHDIGKANEDFYRAVTVPSAERQSVRHEHLSALVLHLPEVVSWLKRSPLLDHDVITAAVLSHHAKAAADGDWEWCQPRAAAIVRLYLQHAQVRAILERVAKVASIGPPPALPVEPWTRSGVWEATPKRAQRAAQAFELACSDPSLRRGVLIATKVGVIAADSAASGLVRENKTFDWIGERSNASSIAADEIDHKIIEPRIQQVTEARRRTDPGYVFSFHRFQLGTAAIGPRALVLAACGTGKTLAAWKWAAAQAQAREIGKVVFLYPTRATATEGFRDYVSWAPEADASLISGTARYELDAMDRNPSDEGHGKRFQLSQEDERLYSLAYWSRRFFSATVDQFLGVMEHSYTGLCLLPVLADSAVIIDEVHSFDESMFKNLIAFLEAFDVPVLCMTATLQSTRRCDLEKVGLVVYPREEDRAGLRDLEDEEQAPRYQVRKIDRAAAALTRAIAAYQAEGKRVLWVVNTVDRCIAQARLLEEHLHQPVTCYHSRFKLSDRQRRHKTVVEQFKQRDHAAIAVTTQVCEMSLDLDADLLITELAPVTSLVQRFGRSNRDRKREGKDPGFRAEILVYKPERALPYRREEIEAAERFLSSLGNGDISQKQLADGLKEFAPGESSADGIARLLDSGYYATPGSFREIEERSKSCVLSRDVEEVAKCLEERSPWDGFIVPVPEKEPTLDDSVRRPDKLPKWVRIADVAHYDELYGYFRPKGGEIS